jgi:hypothetical protein
LLLYSHYPLRNDFGDVRILSKTAYNNLGDKDQGNYLITEQGGKKMTLVLNEYKTAHKYGQKRITLEPAVTKALRKWFQHNGSAYLLRTKAGQPLGSNGITKALGRIGLQHLQRRLGSSLLRHSYLSHKYKDTLDEKKEDADLDVQRHIQSWWSVAQQPAPRSNEPSAHIERRRRQRRWGGGTQQTCGRKTA